MRTLESPGCSAHRPRARLVAATAALAAACGTGVPLPRLPQVEQAQEVVQGDRQRHYQTCASTARGVEPLVECMQSKGYQFVPRGPDYPSSECWRLRDDVARQDRLPEAFCFLRQRQ